MIFEDPRQFRTWRHKAVTLMGMSGVGKSTLARRLPHHTWFHYSADYRIGTRYLQEPILDNIKKHAMRDPFLANLLRTDSIYIASNITVDNLDPIATFLGKVGDPVRGGLDLGEFKRRQALHRDAEIKAMDDVVAFIRKAYDIYGYQSFINDASGSLCELDHPPTFEGLAAHTVILYIDTDGEVEQTLVQRAALHPKPLYYQAAFLDRSLETFMTETGCHQICDVDPDAFVRWVFPHLLAHRLPLYRNIASRYGYSVPYRLVTQVRDDVDLVELICDAIAERQQHPGRGWSPRGEA
ncbi:MAG: ATPase [Candidatus Competibacterales bacterium]